MRIVNFGSCNVDYVYHVEHMVRPGETLSAPVMEIFPGGKGLNQTVAAARAGAQVFHAGYVGSDGNICWEMLGECGADLTHLTRLEEKNGHAIIQLDARGENSIVIYPGTNARLTEADIDRVLDRFTPDDLVLLQNEVSHVPEIIEKACARGMKILFNPAPYDSSLQSLDLSKISYLVLNETEAQGLFGTCDPQRLLQSLGENHPGLQVVLTLGERGCAYLYGDEAVTCPAFCVQAVDTTAAGDTFTGYFAALVCEGASIPEILRTACAASALAVSNPGAASSIPTRTQTLDALKWLREK